MRVSSTSVSRHTRRAVLRRIGALASSVSVLTVASTLLDACGQLPAPRPTSTVGGAKTTFPLNLWFGQASGPYFTTLQQVLAAWTSANPQYPVKVTYDPDDIHTYSKFMTAVASGNPPDVMWFNRPGVLQWASQNAFTDLAPYARASNIDPSDFVPVTMRQTQWNGHLYALPGGPDALDCRALFANLDVLKKANINIDYIATIADLSAAAEKLTKRSGDSFERLGFIPWAGNWFLVGWIWNWGGHLGTGAGKDFAFNVTSAEAVAALTYMTEQARIYAPATVTQVLSGFGTNANDPLVTGQMPLVANFDGMVDIYRTYAPHLNYTVIPVPTPTSATKPTSWTGGFCFTIPHGAAHPEISWKLVEFLCNEDNSKTFAIEAGTLPARLALLHDSAFSGGPRRKVFAELAPGLHSWPAVPGQAEIFNQVVTDATNNALYGKMSPKAALQQAQTEVGKYLATIPRTWWNS